MRSGVSASTLIDQMARAKTAPARLRSAVPTQDNDAGWWMITLSDLTMLMIGFLALWYTSNKTVVTAPSAIRPQPPVAQRSAATSLPQNDPSAGEDWQAVHQDLVNFIASAGLSDDVNVESTADEIKLSLRDNIPFASAKADLRPRALPVLEKVVAVILTHPKLTIAISGHTDSLRIANAEFPSNWELSAARASRVARYLIEKGIHPGRISVQGFADYRPRKPNSSASNRRTNRRVEITLIRELLVDDGKESTAKDPR